ncbi:hypothetical protein ACR9E3_15885 [Actinomycetospora sp. C-140]
MTVQPTPRWQPPYQVVRADRRERAVRAHSITALGVILGLGGVGALLAMIVGLLMADDCTRHGWAWGSGSPDCSVTAWWLDLVVSPASVALGAALAITGLVLARRGGGHGWAFAAWTVWGGSCAVWWASVLVVLT